MQQATMSYCCPKPLIPGTFIGTFFKNGGRDADSLNVFTSADLLNWRTRSAPAYSNTDEEYGHDFDIMRHGDFWFCPYTKYTFDPANLGNVASFGLLRSLDLESWHKWADIDTNVEGRTMIWSWAPDAFHTFAGDPVLSCSVTDIDPSYPANLETYYFTPTSADLSEWSAPTRLTGTLGFSNEFDNHFFQFQDGETYGRILGNGLQIYLATSTSPFSGYTIQNQILPGGIAKTGEGFTTAWLGEGHLALIYKDYAAGALVLTESEDYGVTWGAVQAIPSLVGYDHGGIYQL